MGIRTRLRTAFPYIYSDGMFKVFHKILSGYLTPHFGAGRLIMQKATGIKINVSPLLRIYPMRRDPENALCNATFLRLEHYVTL